MARKPVRSGSKLCILEYGVAPSRVEWGDLLAKYVAVNISSPHMNGGKSPSFIRHRVILASVCPSLSDTPFCCGVLVAVYSMLFDPRSDAQGPELLSSIFATFVASKILDPES